MRIFTNIEHSEPLKGCALTIGSFDGLHLGHRSIIRKVSALSSLFDKPSVILTFDPHPREIIYPRDNSLKLITTLSEKMRLFELLEVDYLVIYPFSVEFSQLMPQEYIEKFILGTFDPSAVIVGYDHRFGVNRQGDIRMLESYAEQCDFELVEVDQQTSKDITVSSTKIREAILNGDLKYANELLGYNFLLSGKVVHGAKIGYSLGFPTANVEIADSRKIIPPDGIFAVYVHVDGNKYKGMLYIGTRPSVKSNGQRSIEVHIFNFNEYIYGREITLEVVDFIRRDHRFDSIDELKAALKSDKVLVNQSLEQHEMDEPFNLVLR